MVKTLVWLVFLTIASVQYSNGITASGHYRDPENPGKCTITKDLVLSPGDVIDDPQLECGNIICALDGLVLFNGCNKRFVEGCEMGAYVNKSLPYPLCCRRRLICD